MNRALVYLRAGHYEHAIKDYDKSYKCFMALKKDKKVTN